MLGVKKKFKVTVQADKKKSIFKVTDNPSLL